MKVFDEVNGHLYFQMTSEEMLMMLQFIREKKRKEIADIKNKINKYEKKKRSEEAFYQSLSPIRKFFTSRAPHHHQAVEYIVHVKERLKQIDRIKRVVSELDHAIIQLDQDSSKDEIVLSNKMIDEIRAHRKAGDSKA